MRFQVKFRVKSASGVRHDCAVDVDPERGFEVSTETLCVPGLPRHPNASFFIKFVDQVPMVESRPEDPGVPLNDKFVKQFPIHIGDRVQLDEFSIELMEISRIEETSSEVRILEFGSHTSEQDANASTSPGTENTKAKTETKNSNSPANTSNIEKVKDFTKSLFSQVNLTAPPPSKTSTSVPAFEEHTNTKTEADTIPQVSVAPVVQEQWAGMSTPKSSETQKPSESPQIPQAHQMPHVPQRPAEFENPFQASVRSSPDDFKYENDPWLDQLKESVSAAVIAFISSLLIAPRVGAFLSTTHAWPGFWLLMFLTVIIFGLCVGFAYLIDRISESLDLVKSFPEYFRFFSFVCAAMVFPAFALLSFPRFAALLFVAIGVGAYKQFYQMFRPDDLKLKAVFGAYFGTLFVFFYIISFAVPKKVGQPFSAAGSREVAQTQGETIAHPNALGAAQASLPTGSITSQSPVVQQSISLPIQPITQSFQPIRRETEETDTASRSLREIDADLGNAESAVPKILTQTPNKVSNKVQRKLARAQTKRQDADLFAVAQLFSAAKSGNLPVVREMIEKRRVNPNQHTEGAVTPLMVAAYGGQTEVVRYLLSRGAKINSQNHAGTTPLIFAVYGNHKDTVSMLVRSGANSRIRTKKGDSALDIAIRIKNREIVWILEGKEALSSKRKGTAKRTQNHKPAPKSRVPARSSSTHGKSGKPATQSPSSGKASKSSKKKKTKKVAQ